MGSDSRGDEAPARPVVLVAEDDETLRRLIRRALEDDYRVVEAENGRQAIDLLERISPSVIVTDVMMPEQDGYAVLEYVRASHRLDTVPVLLMTAMTSPNEVVEGLERGAHDYLKKPIGVAELRARVRAATRVRHLCTELLERSNELEAALASLEQSHEALSRAEKLAALGSMLAGLAHELNNPLGIIHGYTKRLLRDHPEDAALTPALAAVERHSRRCIDLVSALLRFSGGSPERATRLDVQEFFADSLALLEADARRAGVALRPSIEQAPEALQAFVVDFQTAFLNVARNAIQASPRGETIDVVLASAVRDGIAGLSLTVRDRGCGIPAELLGKVFVPFFTTKAPGQGTGLGLSLAQASISRHGGAIDVENVEPGLRVTLWVPLAGGTVAQGAR